MKVYHPSEKLTSLKTQILQLQLTLELSQIQEILSAYSDLLLFFAEYSFLFINDSTQTPVLNDKHSNFEGCFITQDPARDGINWYAYCNNNPLIFLDLSGKIAYSYYDSESNKYKVFALEPNKSKTANILYSILDFYPFSIGEIGKRWSEFITPYDNLHVIESSTTKEHVLSEITNNNIENFGYLDDTFSIMSKISNKISPSSKVSKYLSKTSNIVGNISTYIISPMLLGLSVVENDSGVLDCFISDLFSTNLESNTRLGVEKKYEYARDSIISFSKEGVLNIEYSRKENQIFYQINDNEKFDLLIKELNEME